MTDRDSWRPAIFGGPRPTYTNNGSSIGDPFNLTAEAAIVASGVRKVFTPHQPIRSGEELAGRSREITAIMAALNTPGQHPLVHGARGVGKSSLVNVVAHTYVQANTTPILRFTKRCDHTDTFESILLEPLAAAGVDVRQVEYVTKQTTIRKAEIGIEPFTIGRERESGREATYRPEGAMGAADAARYLARLRGFLLVDELDVVEDPAAKRKLAELIKLLVDEGADFKLFLVGIADTAVDLMGAHQSVQRHLHQTSLNPMTVDELSRIVVTGGDALRLPFADEVVRRIAELSAGYPHFTHLLALKCAENAIRTSTRSIVPETLRLAMSLAVEDAEETLKRSFVDSVRSTTDAYRALLVAAATLGDEFTTAELRGALSGTNPSTALRKLATEDGSTILRRTGRGVYRFTDPRMRPYIRIREPASLTI